MATKLRKLKIGRVDLVSRGANQEADVVLFKHDSTEDIHKRDAAMVRNGNAPTLERAMAKMKRQGAEDAYSTIEERAKELMQRSRTPMTMDDATQQVCKEHPELYRSFSQAVKG